MRIHRRALLGFPLWGAGLGLTGLPAMAAGETRAAPERWIIDDTSAVADTESGTVMGYVRGGIRIFMGIPYGAIAVPDGRWRRAAKPTPWPGKRSCRAVGPTCPADNFSPSIDEVALRDSDLLLTREGEDCLHLNVWTPGLDNKKRQVLFYCHGGGFVTGSAMMEARYEGHNLARHGDVVVVNFNHRLNALGYLDLSAHGADYADSANIGMLDIIDALQWVKSNIANFGGDPDRVMIFGQSGGGAKVLTLLGMPAAKGLFAKAVAQSPAGPLPLSTPEQGAALTAAFFKEVNVAPGDIDALRKLPLATIKAAATKLLRQWQVARGRYDQWNTPANNGWRPVVDGRNLLYQPSNPTTPSDVPLMTGSTLHETYGALGHPEYMTMAESDARAIGRRFFGPVADGMYDVYRSAFPQAVPYEISAMVRATGVNRATAVKVAQRRAALGAAPSYNYWFQWRADTFEGRAMSHHEIEIPLVFMNSDAIPTVTGGTDAARALSLKMADSWLAFAHTGNPATPALPAWNPVTPGAMTSMVFDNDCHIDHGADLAAIEMFWKDRFPGA